MLFEKLLGCRYSSRRGHKLLELFLHTCMRVGCIPFLQSFPIPLNSLQGLYTSSHFLPPFFLLPIYCSWLSSAQINAMTKRKVGKSLFHLTAEPRKTCCFWLPFHGLLSLSFHTARDATIHSGLGHPTSIINQENKRLEKRFSG